MLQATVGATVLALSRPSIAQTASSDDVSLNTAFVEFTRGIGGTPHDAGGSVTFTGRDPIVRSRFRTGACMVHDAQLLERGEKRRKKTRRSHTHGEQ